MNKKSLLTLLGVVLFSSLSQSNVPTSSVSKKYYAGETEEAARLVADLILRGYIRIEPETGQIELQKTVLGILREYNLISPMEVSTIMANGCSGTTARCDKN